MEMRPAKYRQRGIGSSLVFRITGEVGQRVQHSLQVLLKIDIGTVRRDTVSPANATGMCRHRVEGFEFAAMHHRQEHA